jgi:hypothetical protein
LSARVRGFVLLFVGYAVGAVGAVGLGRASGFAAVCRYHVHVLP